MDNLKLTDLLNVEILQHIQESFYDFTGIPAVITDENGIPLIERDGDNADFCFQLTRKSPKGDLRCRQCDRDGVCEANRTGKPAVYVCHAGLVDFAVPIMLGNRVIGGIVGGQVRPDKVDEERLKRVAAELDIDPQEYVAAAERAMYVPLEQVEKAAGFLASIAKDISLMAHENHKAMENSRKSERSARSHSNFMISVGTEFSGEMKGWLDELGEITAKFADNPEICQKLKNIMFRGRKLNSMVAGAVDYMHSSSGIVDFSEGLYDVRKVITEHVMELEEEAGQQGMELRLCFDEDLPKELVGNAGRIGLIVNKIVRTCMKCAAGSRTLEVHASCEKKLYSVILLIRVIDLGKNINQELVSKIIEYVHGETLGEVDDEIQYLDIPLIFMFTHKMSGEVKVQKNDANVLEISLKVPQLMGTGV